MADQESISQLEAKFPRVAYNLTTIWHDAEARVYFNRLVVDTRAGPHTHREGFPPEVMDELLFLGRIHDELYPVDDSPVSRLKFL